MKIHLGIVAHRVLTNEIHEVVGEGLNVVVAIEIHGVVHEGLNVVVANEMHGVGEETRWHGESNRAENNAFARWVRQRTRAA